MKYLSILAAATAVAFFAAQDPAWARRGSAVTDQGQGNLNNDNVKNNPGTVTETTTGPPGQIKNERFECNNCETTTTGPGNK
jgi:hypothetical protein